MSTWRMVITFDWPDTFPDEIIRGGKPRQPHMQDVLFEALEPFNRDNILWYDAQFELQRSPEGDY